MRSGDVKIVSVAFAHTVAIAGESASGVTVLGERRGVKYDISREDAGVRIDVTPLSTRPDARPEVHFVPWSNIRGVRLASDGEEKAAKPAK